MRLHHFIHETEKEPNYFYKECPRRGQSQTPQEDQQIFIWKWTSYAVKGVRSSLFCGRRSLQVLLRESPGFCFVVLKCTYLHCASYSSARGFHYPVLYKVSPENRYRKWLAQCNWNTANGKLYMSSARAMCEEDEESISHLGNWSSHSVLQYEAQYINFFYTDVLAPQEKKTPIF